MTLMITGAVLPTNDTNKRGEIKLTGTIANGHTIAGDFTNNATTQNNRFSLNSNSLDPTTLVSETQPNDLFVANYNGVLVNRFFATLQFSQKRFEFENAGGTNTAIAADSSTPSTRKGSAWTSTATNTVIQLCMTGAPSAPRIGPWHSTTRSISKVSRRGELRRRASGSGAGRGSSPVSRVRGGALVTATAGIPPVVRCWFPCWCVRR
jgi:hypothetical protein